MATEKKTERIRVMQMVIRTMMKKTRASLTRRGKRRSLYSLTNKEKRLLISSKI